LAHKLLSLSLGSSNNNLPQPLPRQLLQHLQHKEMEEDFQETPLPSSLEIAPLQSNSFKN
jgi:hypothetical protein